MSQPDACYPGMLISEDTDGRMAVMEVRTGSMRFDFYTVPVECIHGLGLQYSDRLSVSLRSAPGEFHLSFDGLRDDEMEDRFGITPALYDTESESQTPDMDVTISPN